MPSNHQPRFLNFPWRIFIRYTASQSGFLALCLFLVALGLHFHFRDEFGEPEIVSVIDHALIVGFLALFVFTSLYSMWLGQQFFLPLGRLIVKARTLHTRRQSRPSEDEGDENGEEWQQLEAVLDRIQHEMRSTSDRLSKGRQEINTLMSAISEAILAVDVSGQAIFYNERFVTLFLGGRGWPDRPRLGEIFREPDVLESFKKAIHSGETVHLNMGLAVRTEGAMRDYNLSVSPLRNREGLEVYGALGIFHDITELKQAERIRIEFVGNASHELRTPLTSIKGYVETLRGDLSSGRNDGVERFLDIISRNVDRLIALVSDLLDLSTIEGRGEIFPEKVSTVEITEMVLRNLEKERAPRGQKVVCSHQRAEVFADPAKLEQVLTNLVQNAIKYIPEGKTITVAWEAGDGGTLLKVEDDGPGIAQKHLPRLFERFYRVDAGRAREAGGTGLGLAIVKHICLKHGGWVKVTSEVGLGTSFTCFFPDSGS